MYDFVNGKEGQHLESLKEIEKLEKKYGIEFPQVLKEYYSKYDGEKIHLRTLMVDGYEWEVAKFVPIVSEKMNFESIADGDREDGFISADYYPIARDRGGNYYYWDAKTGNVYLVLVDDYEEPIKVADSVGQFLQDLCAEDK